MKKKGEITLIQSNRPEVFNCIGPRTHQELVEAWDDFRVDESAKVAIITGKGDKAFSSGGDITRLVMSWFRWREHHSGNQEGIKMVSDTRKGTSCQKRLL